MTINLFEALKQRQAAYVRDDAFEAYLAIEGRHEQAKHSARILRYGFDPQPETAPKPPPGPEPVRGLARQIWPDEVLEEGLRLMENWRRRADK